MGIQNDSVGKPLRKGTSTETMLHSWLLHFPHISTALWNPLFKVSSSSNPSTTGTSWIFAIYKRTSCSSPQARPRVLFTSFSSSLRPLDLIRLLFRFSQNSPPQGRARLHTSGSQKSPPLRSSSFWLRQMAPLVPSFCGRLSSDGYVRCLVKESPSHFGFMSCSTVDSYDSTA